jgi:hypothetical protein
MENTSNQGETKAKGLRAFKVSKQVLIPVVGLVVFAAVAAAAYFYMPSKYRALTGDQAAQKAVDYVNANMLANGVKATYDTKTVKLEDGLYAFKLSVEGQDYDAYVTKSGKMFFPQVIDISGSTESQPAETEIAKTDKPDVKIFVMSYCPYGLQAQKMYLPVYNLLKDKATMGIYFVNYAMHGQKELNENLRQYCIQKEQGDKYAAYLECFTASTAGADGAVDPAACLTKAGVDKAKVKACVSATDTEFKVTENFNNKETWLSGNYPTFKVNDDLNTKYNVQGSPTIVVNETDAASSLTARTPEAFKQLVCAAFNTQPAECQTTLSSDAPIPGFGAGTDASASSGGGCGN